ncbi:MAG: V-type ATP synthase subunit A [Verrucomicrobia bacterium]|nr:V-type ATP synthase subunit A [Verrucomicrobiota bacterium]MBS0645612.1 V-type ATP synthase subunit A [Verrucomicrobiota bacterium]
MTTATGKVVKAFGNLLQVKFEGDVRQGEVAFVNIDETKLKAEIIEIVGDEVKIQVFEDTRGIQLGTPVEFTGDLLEAELGPGLLRAIFDGLQNPLEKVAEHSGCFLPRGIYMPAIDRQTQWDYVPVAKTGDVLDRGDTLGTTMEGRFEHLIMVPFSFFGRLTLTWVAAPGCYTVEQVIAKGVDEKGKEYALTMLQKWPIKMALSQGEKISPTKMMDTGMRILDTQMPVLKGGTFCTPGPFGAGKTVLQHHLSKYSSVDIVVLCACGERAGEVVEVLREFPELTDPHTHEPLIHRTSIICNTSSMPVAARESSIYLGMTIAEYYRQMGLDVLLLADSTSRWAQALREMSGRLEEIPGEEAFPAYLASRIAAFYERAGVLSLQDGRQGSITLCGAVSPAGGNFEEPVTQATLSVVGAFCGLSRSRSDARRYPAVDPLISWSKYVGTVAKQIEKRISNWGEMVERAAYFLQAGNEIGKRMEVVGEEGISLEDMMIHLKAELYDFCYLQQNAFDPVDSYSPLHRQIPLFTLINEIFVTEFAFPNRDTTREFFLNLQGKIKTLNSLEFEGGEYEAVLGQIREMMNSAKLTMSLNGR